MPRSVCVLVLSAVLAAIPARGADTVPALGGPIELTPLIHSSVQVEHAGKVIQIDPWTRGGLSRAKPADLILVTDADAGGHHLDPAAIGALRKPGTPVVIPAAGKEKVPDGIAMANGETKTVGGFTVEAIAAYDVTPGESFHPPGEANGYVVAVGGKRLYFAGVTECIPEVKALKNIDVAFMPMNVPADRMTPEKLADCVKAFRPKIVYPYHFDNARLRPGAAPANPASPPGFDALRAALKGEHIEIRSGDWYPAAAAR